MNQVLIEPIGTIEYAQQIRKWSSKISKMSNTPKTSQDTKIIIFLEEIIQKSLNISKKILRKSIELRKVGKFRIPKWGVLYHNMGMDQYL